MLFPPLEKGGVGGFSKLFKSPNIARPNLADWKEAIERGDVPSAFAIAARNPLNGKEGFGSLHLGIDGNEVSTRAYGYRCANPEPNAPAGPADTAPSKTDTLSLEDGSFVVRDPSDIMGAHKESFTQAVKQFMDTWPWVRSQLLGSPVYKETVGKKLNRFRRLEVHLEEGVAGGDAIVLKNVQVVEPENDSDKLVLRLATSREAARKMFGDVRAGTIGYFAVAGYMRKQYGNMLDHSALLKPMDGRGKGKELLRTFTEETERFYRDEVPAVDRLKKSLAQGKVPKGFKDALTAAGYKVKEQEIVLKAIRRGNVLLDITPVKKERYKEVRRGDIHYNPVKMEDWFEEKKADELESESPIFMFDIRPETRQTLTDEEVYLLLAKTIIFRKVFGTRIRHYFPMELSRLSRPPMMAAVSFEDDSNEVSETSVFGPWSKDWLESAFQIITDMRTRLVEPGLLEKLLGHDAFFSIHASLQFLGRINDVVFMMDTRRGAERIVAEIFSPGKDYTSVRFTVSEKGYILVRPDDILRAMEKAVNREHGGVAPLTPETIALYRLLKTYDRLKASRDMTAYAIDYEGGASQEVLDNATDAMGFMWDQSQRDELVFEGAAFRDWVLKNKIFVLEPEALPQEFDDEEESASPRRRRGGEDESDDSFADLVSSEKGVEVDRLSQKAKAEGEVEDDPDHTSILEDELALEEARTPAEEQARRDAAEDPEAFAYRVPNAPDREKRVRVLPVENGLLMLIKGAEPTASQLKAVFAASYLSGGIPFSVYLDDRGGIKDASNGLRQPVVNFLEKLSGKRGAETLGAEMNPAWQASGDQVAKGLYIRALRWFALNRRRLKDDSLVPKPTDTAAELREKFQRFSFARHDDKTTDIKMRELFQEAVPHYKAMRALPFKPETLEED